MGGVLADEILGGLYVFGCDPSEWVILVGPFVRHDNAVDFNFEEEPIAHTPAAGNANRHIILHCDKADALVCACLATEEINEDALFAGVLVGDKAQTRTCRGDGFYLLGCSLFVDYPLAGALTGTLKVIVYELIVQGPCDAVHIETEKGKQVSHYLEVAVVAGNPDNALPALHHPLGSLNVYVCRVPVPVVALNETRGKQDIDNKHYYLLKGAPAGLDEPLFVFIGEAGPEVIEGTLTPSVVMLPHLSAEKARKTQVCLDTEPVHYQKCDPQRSICQPIEHGIGLLLPSFSGRLRHSR